MSGSPHRKAVLSLYRAILQTHKKKLPSDLRMLGDAYAREEFKAHQKAKPEHLVRFLQQWTVRPNFLSGTELTLHPAIPIHHQSAENSHREGP